MREDLNQGFRQAPKTSEGQPWEPSQDQLTEMASKLHSEGNDERTVATIWLAMVHGERPQWGQVNDGGADHVRPSGVSIEQITEWAERTIA